MAFSRAARPCSRQKVLARKSPNPTNSSSHPPPIVRNLHVVDDYSSSFSDSVCCDPQSLADLIAPSMQERKRLHISPLNPDLLPIVLGQTLLNKAENTSFHAIETFPEKNYGYLELPLTEADRLRKKLNGCVLRGQKMKVEEARSRRTTNVAQSEVANNGLYAEKNRTKKSKSREDGAIPAIELPDERKVKRGWTEAKVENENGPISKMKKDKKDKKTKSKDASITGETECLFKTKVPPNAQNTTQDRGHKPKKRKRGQSEREFVVHEFENTTKHAGFLRDDSVAKDKKVVNEYIEGKGWVDEDGNVVEKEAKRRKHSGAKVKSDDKHLDKEEKSRDKKTTVGKASKVEKRPKDEETDETSSSGTSESEVED
ncbi:MAG: hypothetical protein Q9164_007103, partial [Protoblastenia rupestris]